MKGWRIREELRGVLEEGILNGQMTGSTEGGVIRIQYNKAVDK